MTTCEEHRNVVVCFQSPQLGCPLCEANKDLQDSNDRIEQLDAEIEALKVELDSTKNTLLDLQTRIIENA